MINKQNILNDHAILIYTFIFRAKILNQSELAIVMKIGVLKNSLLLRFFVRILKSGKQGYL